MNELRDLLRDRRWRQRGSALSAVLIIVAFLSLIAGAVMTDLSTSFLISRHLVTRVTTEATVDSAVESTIYQLQQSPLDSGCPAPSQITLNGLTASASFVTCAAVVDSRSPQFVQLASSQPFTLDGTHVVLPATGTNEYLVGDSGGTVYAFPFGRSTPAWRFRAAGSLTAPPTAMPDMSGPPATLDLVPIAEVDANADNPPCGTPLYCVAVLEQSPGQAPQPLCTMPANGRVSVRPVQGVNLAGVAFFGDAGGTVYAYGPSGDSGCPELATYGTGSQPIAGAMAVFAGAAARRQTNDELFVITSDGSSSRLLHLTFVLGRGPNRFQLDSSLSLPAAGAVGMTTSSSTLPARLAITFAGGQIAAVQVGSDLSMSLAASTSIGTPIVGAPYWCHCRSGDEIGVGGTDGLYIFDAGLNRYASFSLTPGQINTTPAADSGGDWFVATDAGYVIEAQKAAGQSMVEAARFGGLGSSIGSSIALGTCATGLCLYTATQGGNAYLIDLDARDAVVTSCISASPPSCAGTNPRLWARVEVGAMGSPQTVHVTGWSYYSP